MNSVKMVGHPTRFVNHTYMDGRNIGGEIIVRVAVGISTGTRGLERLLFIISDHGLVQIRRACEDKLAISAGSRPRQEVGRHIIK